MLSSLLPLGRKPMSLAEALEWTRNLCDDAKFDFPSKISGSCEQGRQQNGSMLVEICPQSQKGAPDDAYPRCCYQQGQTKRCATLLVPFSVVKRNRLCITGVSKAPAPY
jgi:hypothetical protein